MSNGFLTQEEIDSLLNGNVGGNVDNKEAEILSDIEKDLLGEIGNISMGSASTALYQLTNKQVNITTPRVKVTTLREIKESFKYPNIILDVEYTSGIMGRNILIMQTKDAAVIANLMMGGDGIVNTTELSELEISAVQEAMNQMIGSAATSMATMFSREVNISPPKSKIWKSITESITEEIPEDDPIIEVKFDLTIEGLLNSSMMQILPIETGKKIVAIMTGEEQEEAAITTENHTEPEKTEVYNKSTEIYEKPIEIQEESREERSARKDEKPVEVHKASFGELKQGTVGESHRNLDLILDVPLNIYIISVLQNVYLNYEVLYYIGNFGTSFLLDIIRIICISILIIGCLALLDCFFSNLYFVFILFNYANITKSYKPLPKFPAVTRDMALLVDDEILVQDIEDTIRRAGGNLVEKVKLFDIYKGAQIPEGKKSIAYSIAYRDDKKTLTDNDVNKVHDKILRSLEHKLGAILR